MSRTRVAYLQDEDKVILEQIDLYPDNKREAFRQAEARISELFPEHNRNWKDIQARYYSTMFERRNTFNSTVGSKIGFTKDRKNNPVKQGETFQREEPLEPIIVVMQQMLTLNRRQRNAIIAFLNSID